MNYLNFYFINQSIRRIAMCNKLSLFIVLLILINMIALSTMHVPQRGDVNKDAIIEHTIHDGKCGYFVYDIWFPLFETVTARPRGQQTLNQETHCTYQIFQESICRIKDRWSELLYA